jgi:hypothetical protein
MPTAAERRASWARPRLPAALTGPWLVAGSRHGLRSSRRALWLPLPQPRSSRATCSTPLTTPLARTPPMWPRSGTLSMPRARPWAAWRRSRLCTSGERTLSRAGAHAARCSSKAGRSAARGSPPLRLARADVYRALVHAQRQEPAHVHPVYGHGRVRCGGECRQGQGHGPQERAEDLLPPRDRPPRLIHGGEL